jgi:hypothetical protein
MDKKTCVNCKIEKPNGGFRLYSNGTFGSTCKNCLNEFDKTRKKNLRAKNLETLIYKCSLCQKEKSLKEFSKLKKNYKKKICLECYPNFLKDEKTKWCADERKSNMNYRIKKSLAARLRTVLQKETTTMSYIGCPIQYLREWFEYNFTSKMNWKNYGSYWHIDHIIPVECFDLQNETEKYICWNWTNLVPLDKTTNCSKKCFIVKTQVESIKDNLIKFKEEGSTTKWFSDNHIIILQPFESILEKYGSNNVKTV